MIYFVQLECVERPIKIGVCRELKRRLDGLQTASPFALRTLVTVNDWGFEEEATLHHRFARDRIRGEWFRPSPKLLEFVDRLVKLRELLGDIPPDVARYALIA